MSIPRAIFLLFLVPSLAHAASAAPLAGASLAAADASDARQAAPTSNAISGMKMERTADGGWTLTLDYAYTGVPAGAQLEIKQLVTPAQAKMDPVPYRAAGTAMEKGRHRVSLPLRPPGEEHPLFTQQVIAEMRDSRYALLASAVLDQRFEWPGNAALRSDKEVATQSPEIVLARAVALIDDGSQRNLGLAKLLLERLVKRQPRLDQAYLELARVAMKTNWGPDGLREAEALIKSALEIRPDGVNAKILLGYVYSNVGRDKEAVALFQEVARAGTTNLWLWTNWGEMLARQGKRDGAIEKFRLAIKHPPTGDSSDGARHKAYHGLVATYAAARDLDALEAVYRQRRAEYPDTICYGLAYARFLVTMRGNAAEADAILKTIPPAKCETGEGRMIQALIRYVAWAGAKGPERAEALRLARVTMPVSPRLFQLLAETDHTLVAAKQLVAAGEALTMQDNQRMDALAYALVEGDVGAAGRLVAIGARTDALVGPDQMPVALLPVVARNLAGIELMQRSGVDYKLVRFRDLTAYDVARQIGDEQLLKALNSRPRKL